MPKLQMEIHVTVSMSDMKTKELIEANKNKKNNRVDTISETGLVILGTF